ncbi:serine hydrolase FSH [Aspergillus avenaceus]|uniref:Serine hydrolase FSH n=1 Tax=Aspergillus avenaceus TaxID=36643 RepID=A0A5N6TUU0_ASPAV|nr:serine hydrolase FSH [Aspergillus avenaceus]
MKFLCLPGSYISAKTFQTQLKPLCDCLSRDGTTNFVFTQGDIPVSPPEEFEGFFGPRPNYAFVKPDDIGAIMFNMRNFPKRETPEDTMRLALKMAGQPTFSDIVPVMDRLIEILDTEGDIDGVLGYSEGAEIAASLLIEETRRQKEYGREPRIKYAVFIGGWPPIHPSIRRVVLADEVGEIIKIPTCHVVGAADPYIDGSMALYNVCDPDQADLFDHGGGHIIPREKNTVQDLVNMIWETIEGMEQSR